jgi:flagellar biosynthetic protein FlhB
MAGDKTEQPTPKRLRDARKKGQVLKSQDLTQAFTFLAAAGILAAGGPILVSQLRELLAACLSPELLRGPISTQMMFNQLEAGMTRFLLLTAPVMCGLAFTAAAIVFLQVKPLFSPQVVQPKFDKLNPIQGFQGIFFKGKTYVEAAKSVLKFIVIFAIVYYAIKGSMRELILTSRLGVENAGALTGSLITGLMLRAGGVFLLIGAADFLLQHKFYMKNLMMSKDEIKQEYKQDEGDPHIKHQRRQLQEQMAMHGATAKVPKANVVVVNPLHLAVALEYDEKAMGAPTVTAKGREEMAASIRELAKQHNIPILQNVPLARTLYEIELGTEIPADLYEAVAEVLNWVQQLRREMET